MFRQTFFLLAFAACGTHGLYCNPRNGKPPPVKGLPPCSLSVADFLTGRALPGSTPRTAAWPSWLNPVLFRKGQAFGQKNFFFAMFATFPGLISGLLLPDETAALAFTGSNADEKNGPRLYVATGAQIQVWLESIFCEEVLDNAFLTSIHNTREHHVKTAERANAVGWPFVPASHYDSRPVDDEFWDAIVADFESSTYKRRNWSRAYLAYDKNTTAINQFALGLGLTQFYGYLIIDPASAYIYDATEEELMAYLHFWAVIGWIFGVDNKYNPALQPDVATAAAHHQALAEEYGYPAWFKPTRNAKVIVETVLSTHVQFFPHLASRQLLVRLLRDFFKVPVKNTMAKLSLPERIGLQTFDATFVPSTHIPAERTALGVGANGGINATIKAVYGPTVDTYLDKAKYAFYPKEP